MAALVSGLDSCIMTGLLAREYAEITPLFVRAGLRWEDAELAALERFFGGAGRTSGAANRGTGAGHQDDLRRALERGRQRMFPMRSSLTRRGICRGAICCCWARRRCTAG